MKKSAFIVVSLLVAASARADLFECSHSAARRVTAPLAGVSHVTVIGRAGSLRVAGRAGARELLASGTACADDKRLLGEMQLTARQSGSELRVEAVIPARTSLFGWNNARLDFEVTLPDSVAVDVTDGSGEVIVENVASLNVNDGSGGLTVRNVSGDLRIVDGSGGIEIDRVGGSVTIDDGSGSISVRNVQRNVAIEDGSGGIEVSDIRGDFTVKHDGSGGIDYERVGGRVSVPRKR